VRSNGGARLGGSDELYRQLYLENSYESACHPPWLPRNGSPPAPEKQARQAR